MPGMFCRHNRLTVKCPICSRELEERPARARRPSGTSRRASPARRRRRARARPVGPRARSGRSSRASSRAPPTTATATRWSPACARPPTRSGSRSRSPPRSRGSSRPGPYPLIADEPDLEQATWLAFLFALAPELQDVLAEAQPALGGRRPVRAARGQGSAPPPPTAPGSSAPARRRPRSPARRAGRPERRFGRVFERLALPGFSRARALRPADRARRRRPLPARGRRRCTSSRTTPRRSPPSALLVSGDRMLLERRARDLAEAADLPIAALDRGLAVWGTPGEHVDLTAEPAPGVAAALAHRIDTWR